MVLLARKVHRELREPLELQDSLVAVVLQDQMVLMDKVDHKAILESLDPRDRLVRAVQRDPVVSTVTWENQEHRESLARGALVD